MEDNFVQGGSWKRVAPFWTVENEQEFSTWMTGGDFKQKEYI